MRFETMNRGWKGHLIFARNEEGKHTENGLFLRIGYSGNSRGAENLAYKLNSGEMTVSQALDKVLKQDVKWLNTAGRIGNLRPALSKEQMEYFGANEEQMQKWHKNEEAFNERVKESMRIYKEQREA